MDFARRQLEKYGWKEGQGLGKNEDGISTALKPSLKFDTAGVGHEKGKDFTNKWWTKVYDNAAKNIEIITEEEDIKVKRLDGAEEVEITTKDYSVRDFRKKSKKHMAYGTFLKTAKLTQEGMMNYENVCAPPESDKSLAKQLSDEELFAICGGRTAHKGARHGLKLSGKLSRIEKQEALLLKQMQKVQLDEKPTKQEKSWQSKKKKLDQMSEALLKEVSQPAAEVKKKKKRKKSVSFSETLLEYHVEEPEEQNSPTEKVRVCERNLENTNEDAVTPDEGIEPDCEIGEEMDRIRKSKKKKKSKKAVEILETAPKKKRNKSDGGPDIDGVAKIKKKKYHHKLVDGLSTSVEDLHISE